MKIVYVGNTSQPHCTEVHVQKTLEALGHEVFPIQENRHDAEDIFERSRHADLFLWTRTWGIKGDAIKLLAKLKEAGIPTASIHLDLYFGISRERDIATDPFWKTEYVFTPDGGHGAEFLKLGINHFWIRAGVFEPECVSGTAHERFDVVFVGSRSYHAEWLYREKLISWLHATYGERFAHFGNGGRPTVRNQALNDVYAGAKVVVGDSLCVGFTAKKYWSDRVYETLGRGGFLIHPWIEGMEDEFTDGEHLLYYNFDDFCQLKSTIDAALALPGVREAIRKRGQKRVRECCTYTHRLKQVLGILNLEK